MSKESFEYGGYHFIPKRTLTVEENDFCKISRKLYRNEELGFYKKGYVCDGKISYSHEGFYEASTDKGCDLFRCVENGRLYIPCENELFLYVERPKKRFSVTITETLEMKVEVEAENQADAEAFVSEKWYNSEYILDADHFKGVTFTAEKILRNREENER